MKQSTYIERQNDATRELLNRMVEKVHEAWGLQVRTTAAELTVYRQTVLREWERRQQQVQAEESSKTASHRKQTERQRRIKKRTKSKDIDLGHSY